MDASGPIDDDPRLPEAHAGGSYEAVSGLEDAARAVEEGTMEEGTPENVPLLVIDDDGQPSLARIIARRLEPFTPAPPGSRVWHLIGLGVSLCVVLLACTLSFATQTHRPAPQHDDTPAYVVASDTLPRHHMVINATHSPTPSPSLPPSSSPTPSPSSPPTTAPSLPPTSPPTSPPSAAPTTAPPTPAPIPAPPLLPPSTGDMPDTPYWQNMGNAMAQENARLSQLRHDMTELYRIKTGNENCSRWLIYPIQHPAGLGSQLMHALLAHIVALWDHRSLALHPDFLTKYRCTLPPSPPHNGTNTTAAPAVHEGGGFGSCFQSLSYGPEECKGGYETVFTPHWEQLPMIWGSVEPTTASHVVRVQDLENVRWVWVRPEPSIQPLEGGERYTYFEFLAYAASQVWRPTPHVQDILDRYKASLNLRGVVCGFHIRRGDKAYGRGKEWKAVPSSEYIRRLVELGVGCDTCFLASDEHHANSNAAPQGEVALGVVEEWEAAITQAIPTCTRIVAPSVLPFVVDQSTSRVDTQAAQSFLDRGFNESTWLAGDASSRVVSTLQLLAEVEVLSDAHAIAVSYSSNLARLLALTRGGRGKARDTAIGVDLAWNFV